MSTPHPEQNEDPRLWELLGQLPEERPASNFAHRVRQKLAAPRPRPSRPAWAEALALWGRWAMVSGLAAAGLAVAFVFLQSRPAHEDETVDLVMVAQHYELIQDLEVIEVLDVLEQGEDGV